VTHLTALAALGSCISVGLLANATHRGVTLTKIQIEMEGDIDIAAVGGDTPDEKLPGFTEVRCKVPLSEAHQRKRLRRSVGSMPATHAERTVQGNALDERLP
jgi:hypothetical protein